ncbi:MAG: DinB family protein [Vicinamibacterales bacterium]
MPDRDELIALGAHMEWADAQTWSTVLQSRAARDDDKTRGWLHHLHTVQRAFTAIWRGESPRFVDAASFADMPALATWGRAGVAGLRAAIDGVDAAGIARRVELPWAQRFAPPGGALTHPTLGDTAQHLALHSAHHRGQVLARLRELGAEPPTVDYIAWIWKGRPEAAWPRNVPPPEIS